MVYIIESDRFRILLCDNNVNLAEFIETISNSSFTDIGIQTRLQLPDREEWPFCAEYCLHNMQLCKLVVELGVNAFVNPLWEF